MGFSKKTARGRLDKYYFLAKDQGYRARSAFKLVQLHKKYSLLDRARVVIDLCAAPGGWLQVAAKYMPVSHVIVGVDLVPIKPIPGVKTIVADITTDKCRSELKKELKTWKADLVLHDGAPNVGKAWLHDAYSQSELVLHSLKLATEFLTAGGAFVTKVFRSKDYNSLLWVFKQLFDRVEATKPASSREVSAEIFVVCKGFKAPTSIDPRFLDPKHVFEDITLLQRQSRVVDLAHPGSTKKPSRDGYEDGSTLLFKSLPVQEFIRSSEPNVILSTYNQLLFTPETPAEISASAREQGEIEHLCGDLRVLGKREFKIISKWRKVMRITLGLDTKAAPQDGEAAAENVVVEEDPLAEAEELCQRQTRLQKREKRKALEKKAKQRLKLQLSMNNADDLANDMDKTGSLFSLAAGKITLATSDDAIPLPSPRSDDEQDVSEGDSHGINESELSTLDEDEDEALWESELEEDYALKIERARSKDAAGMAESLRDKRRRMASLADEGDMGEEDASHDDEQTRINPKPCGEEERDDAPEPTKGPSLVTSLLSKEEEEAEKAAKIALWYSNPLFANLAPGKNPEDILESSNKKLKAEKRKLETAKRPAGEDKSGGSRKKAAPGGIIFVKADPSDNEEGDDEEKTPGDGIEIDPRVKDTLLTPSGMTLAAKFSEDKKRAQKDLIDDSFNRYTFKDDAGALPKWFADDESTHTRPQKPITKEGVALLRAKLKELESRPIRKELEAKGRNRRRVMKRLETLKKKAAVIVDSEEIGERQKSEQIQKLMAKAGKSQRRETKLVIARGSNRGVKGRPRGVKGHFKMVDSRLKKDVRAQKRLKKEAKGKRPSKRQK